MDHFFRTFDIRKRYCCFLRLRQKEMESSAELGGVEEGKRGVGRLRMSSHYNHYKIRKFNVQVPLKNFNFIINIDLFLYYVDSNLDKIKKLVGELWTRKRRYEQSECPNPLSTVLLCRTRNNYPSDYLLQICPIQT